MRNGILRRYVYEIDEQNIVLYSSTIEINKMIPPLLKYKKAGSVIGQSHKA